MNVLIMLALLVSVANGRSFSLPELRFEVFKPRGLRVSIDDDAGNLLGFAFSGNVNRPCAYQSIGDISADVSRRVNGRWVYEDPNIELKRGDVLNYWIFVRKGYLGYFRDGQKYTVKNIIDAKLDFDESFTRTPSPCAAEYSTEPNFSESESAQNAKDWIAIISNKTEENMALSTEISRLKEENEFMKSKLKNDSSTNLLVLEGFAPLRDDPLAFVETFVKDKLYIREPVVLRAKWNENNSITFEAKTFEDKLRIYSTAALRKKSSFVVRDVTNDTKW